MARKPYHKIIILGGNNPNNKTWIQRINKYLHKSFHTEKFYYNHWQENLQDIDFSKEIKRLSRFISDNGITSYSIVAKSAGFVLAMQGIGKGEITPRTVIGYGLPLDYCRYREIDLRSLVKVSSGIANLLCIQASEDPQGDLCQVNELVSDMFPVWGITGHTHNYDEFKQMAHIASAFISTHLHENERSIKKVDAKSLTEAINIVDQSPKKYVFRNSWLFSIDSNIFIFSYKHKNIIIKKGSIGKLKKEVENALMVANLINGVKVNKMKMIAVVPDLFKIDSTKGYLVSEYFGPDCNELFYQSIDGILSMDVVIGMIKKLNKLSILHKDLLPRNVIVKNNVIYLIDWEKVVINKMVVNPSLQYKAALLIGWRYINPKISEEIKLLPSLKTKVLQDEKHLNRYEKFFKNMLGLDAVSNDKISELCYEYVVNATNYEKEPSFSKIDDILHALSEILPIELELFIDLLLCNERNERNNYLYHRLSNTIKIAKLKSFMNVDSIQVKIFIWVSIRDIILEKIANEYDSSKIENSLVLMVKKSYPEAKPNRIFLLRIISFLNSEL